MASPLAHLNMCFVIENFGATIENLVIWPRIQTLAECHCRWPIGDPQHPDFHFCGKTKVAGLPYCEFHARRAFQPPQSRRREPAPAPAAIEAATSDKTKVDA